MMRLRDAPVALRGGVAAPLAPAVGRAAGSVRAGLIAVILVTACAEGGEESSPLPTSLPELRLSEELRIDGHKADLVGIGAVAPHSSGNVAFVQEQDGAVLVMDATGREVDRLGRKGEDPGEFESLRAVGWFGDTLWVWDPRLRRVTLTEVSGGPFRPQTVPVSTAELSVEVPALAEYAREFLVSSVEGILRDGSLHLVLRSRRGGPVPTPFDTLATHVRALPEGRITGVVAQYRDPPLDVMIRSPDEVHAVGVRWPLSSAFGVAPGGRRLVVAQPVLRESPEWTLSVSSYDLEGGTVTGAELPLRAEEIPRAEAREAVDRMIEAAERVSADLARRVQQEARPASIHPPLARVLVGDDGWVLVGLSARAGDHAGRHLLLGPSGEFTGWVSFDGGAPRALDAGRRVWVVERDEVGIQSLIRYALEGPG